jgi:probable F420-dependent oxidoreductase
MACGPLLTAAAAVTTELRIGSYVYNNDFRPPALLAKEAATIDVLSGGRFELGVGAGWAKIEYVLAGITFDPPRVRADRLEEAVPLIRALLAGEQVEHRGQHYRLRGLTGSPAAAQSPVPLLIGGGGPRMIRFAARTADIVGLVPRSLPDGGLDPTGFTAESMDERIGWLEHELEATGRGREDGPERSVLVFAAGGTGDATPELSTLPPDHVDASPHLLLGDTHRMVDALHERAERWDLTYTVCFDRDLEHLAAVISAFN